MPKKINTSWGKDARWYEKAVKEDDSYQQKVILPNLLRVMNIKKGEQILDLGCGTGFFSHEFARAGAKVLGVDVGAELIEIAKKNSPAGIEYVVSSADDLKFINDNTQDKIALVLALQNIEKANVVVKECARVLKNNGRLYIVLNHPTFRIPKASDWGWDDKNMVQYRREDRYLSELKEKIQMHPGNEPSDVTWSFHRPLQYYFKAFGKAGLAVGRLEEWVSHRKTEAGPRKAAEDRARAEFPLFLCLEVVKLPVAS